MFFSLRGILVETTRGNSRQRKAGKEHNMKHFRLEIEGMGCAHCVRSVTEALADLKATVNDVQVGSADVLWDGDTEALKAAISEAGFEVKSIAVL